MNQGTVLLVLGMHRSGTSVLTRTLGFCGGDLPKSGLRPDSEHYEPEIIMRMHDEQLLEPAGRRWHDIGWFPPAWFDSEDARQFRGKLARAFREEFDDSNLPVMKDPRVCRLLPLWLPVFRDLHLDPRAVIVVRNPLEVAASLQARNRMPLKHALWIWLCHLVEAERGSRQIQRCLTSYERLLENWQSVIAEIEDKLSLNLSPPSADHKAKITEYISNSLRHHRTSTNDLLNRTDVPAIIKEVYEWTHQPSATSLSDVSVLDKAAAQLAARDSLRLPLRSAYLAWRRHRPGRKQRVNPV